METTITLRATVTVWAPSVVYNKTDCRIELHVAETAEEIVQSVLTCNPSPLPNVGSIFYGTQPDYNLPTEDIIRSGIEIVGHVNGEDITIHYGVTTEPFQIFWAAWPATDTGINHFFINQFDQDGFGENSTFMPPVQIGEFFYTRVNSATLIDTIIFQHT